MRAALLALLALICVAAAATGAGGRSDRAPSLTFKEVTLDGKRRVLSTHAIDPYTYSLAPDHKELAYISQRCNGCRGPTALMVASVRSPLERVLFDTGCAPLGVSWAPNGRLLAVVAQTGAYCDRGGLWLVNSDGSGFRQVEGHAGLVWSPDSKFLAGSRPISLFSLEAGGERVLSAGHSPAWSPDGTRIAFVHNTPFDLQVLGVLSVETGAVRNYTRANSSNPVWSPDGRRIAFIRFVGDAYHLELWVISTRGGKPRRLARGLARSTPFLWSPKGRQIAYVRGRVLFVRRLNGHEGRFLAYEPGADAVTPLAWSRDGRRVLYVTLVR
jgi:Tol biopolymer transport system component